MQINPGELDKRITIVKGGDETDADGFPVEGRQVVRDCWAKFTRVSGSELNKAGADMGVTKVRFLVRHKPGIDRKMKVEYAGDTYEITYVNDYEDDHRYMEIWAKEVTQRG